MNPDNSNQIMLLLGNIQGEVKGIHTKMDDFMLRFENVDKKINELQAETTVLRSWKDNLMGRLVIIQAIFTAIVGVIIKKI